VTGELQVFIVGTGACLWGTKLGLDHPAGALVLCLTVEPLDSTRDLVLEAGVRVRRSLRTGDRLTRGAIVVIPRDLIDVVYEDEEQEVPA
jgi:hypothetical protein